MCSTNSNFFFATYRSDKISASSLVVVAVQTRRLVAAMCRSDLSHRVSRPLKLKQSYQFCYFVVLTALFWNSFASLTSVNGDRNNTKYSILVTNRFAFFQVRLVGTRLGKRAVENCFKLRVNYPPSVNSVLFHKENLKHAMLDSLYIQFYRTGSVWQNKNI